MEMPYPDLVLLNHSRLLALGVIDAEVRLTDEEKATLLELSDPKSEANQKIMKAIKEFKASV